MNLHGQDAVATGEARQSLKPYCQRSFQTDQYVQLDILNPYAVELLKSLPSLSTERGVRLEEIAGDVPEVADVPPRCRFHPCCPRAFERYAQEVPPLDETDDASPAGCMMGAARKGRKFACLSLAERSTSAWRPAMIGSLVKLCEQLIGNSKLGCR